MYLLVMSCKTPLVKTPDLILKPQALVHNPFDKLLLQKSFSLIYLNQNILNQLKNYIILYFQPSVFSIFIEKFRVSIMRGSIGDNLPLSYNGFYAYMQGLNSKFNNAKILLLGGCVVFHQL